MGVAAVIVVVFVSSLLALACGADFGLIGLREERAWKMLALLVAEKHRVACWDERGDLRQAVIGRGGIAAFEAESVFKFAKTVLVFDAHPLEVASELPQLSPEHELVFFGPESGGGVEVEESELRRAVESRGGQALVGHTSGDSVHVRGTAGAEELRGVLARSRSNFASVADDGHLTAKRSGVCPQQVEGGATLWTTRTASSEMGCENDQLSVCRVFVRLPAPDHRINVVALYGVTGPVRTDDPQGFFQAFPRSVLPPMEEDIAGNPNGRCDSWLTFGVEQGLTCASPDPSFNRTAFLKSGQILVGTGMYCNSPFDACTSPATAAKPPNTADSILIAQLVVRRGFSTSGALLIVSSDAAKKQSKIVQSFNCDCVQTE